LVYLVPELTHDWVPLAEFDEHYCKGLLVWLHKFNLQQELNLVIRLMQQILKLSATAMSSVLCMVWPHIVRYHPTHSECGYYHKPASHSMTEVSMKRGGTKWDEK
jgi:hypothetical protein